VTVIDSPSAQARTLVPVSGTPPTETAPNTQDRLHVVAWRDPVIDRLGFDPRSVYVEQFWLPILGPTAVWFLRRVASELDVAEDGFVVAREEMSRSLGLGARMGKNAPFSRAVTRCISFQMARRHGPHALAVRRNLPPLAQRNLIRLTSKLQRAHEAWTVASRRLPTFDEHRRRARRLAMGLLELAETPDVMEAQLVQWGIHPALANDAVTWARALPAPA